MGGSSPGGLLGGNGARVELVGPLQGLLGYPQLPPIFWVLFALPAPHPFLYPLCNCLPVTGGGVGWRSCRGPGRGGGKGRPRCPWGQGQN